MKLFWVDSSRRLRHGVQGPYSSVSDGVVCVSYVCPMKSGTGSVDREEVAFVKLDRWKWSYTQTPELVVDQVDGVGSVVTDTGVSRDGRKGVGQGGCP